MTHVTKRELTVRAAAFRKAATSNLAKVESGDLKVSVNSLGADRVSAVTATEQDVGMSEEISIRCALAYFSLLNSYKNTRLARKEPDPDTDVFRSKVGAFVAASLAVYTPFFRLPKMRVCLSTGDDQDGEDSVDVDYNAYFAVSTAAIVMDVELRLSESIPDIARVRFVEHFQPLVRRGLGTGTHLLRDRWWEAVKKDIYKQTAYIAEDHVRVPLVDITDAEMDSLWTMILLYELLHQTPYVKVDESDSLGYRDFQLMTRLSLNNFEAKPSETSEAKP